MKWDRVELPGGLVVEKATMGDFTGLREFGTAGGQSLVLSAMEWNRVGAGIPVDKFSQWCHARGLSQE